MMKRHETKSKFVVGFLLTLLLLICGTSSTTWAWEGERVQAAIGAGNTAVAEFDEQPGQGHLLVAISVHRVSWDEAHIENTGWEKVVLHVDEAGDGARRRGLAVWYRVAQTDEPTEISTYWTEDGSSTESHRDNVLLIQEFTGNYVFDTAETNTSGDDFVNSISTGTTDESSTSGDHSLIVGAVGARENSDPANWTSGLNDNLRVRNTDIDTSDKDTSDTATVTLQSAYRTSTNTQEWESTASWGGTSGTAGAGIGVFSQVDWNFSPGCNSEITSDVQTSETAAMLMLDNSLSMQTLGDEECASDTCWTPVAGTVSWCCGNDLWDVAVDAIKSVLDTESDDNWFGLGLFSGSSAEIVLDATETSYDDIPDELDDAGLYGGTPTASAIEETYESATLNDSDLRSAGIVITDGYPTRPSGSAAQAAVDEACYSKNNGYQQFIVGLGGATDTDFNNMLAAAAGTGCCGADAEEGCPNGPGDDPCTTSVNESECYGSFQVGDEDGLREALLSITSELTCTFPVSTEGWEDGATNPATVQVWTDGASSEEIPYTPDPEETGGPPGAFEDGVGGCSESTDYCHYGFCRDPDERMACGSDDDCSTGDWCHEYLGCIDLSDHRDNTSCNDGFIWKDACVEQPNAPSSDQPCTDHSDCVDWSGEHYACNEGYCMYNPDGWCPHDDEDWECANGDDWCHEKLGCIDNDECGEGGSCGDGEICWFGACVDADSGDQCEYEGGGGWYFPPGGDGSQVVLTDYWCEKVQNDSNIEEVTTIRACTNECVGEPGESEGDYCPIGNPSAPGCPAGNLVCDDGELDCKPGDDGANTFPPPGEDDCPFHCPENAIEGEPCVLGCDVIWTPEIELPILPNIPPDYYQLDSCTEDGIGQDEVEQPLGRCDAGDGMVECVDTVYAECVIDTNTYRPMPETCDGLDNSCDGEIDNIAQSWIDYRNCEGTWDSSNWDDDWGPNPCGSGAMEIEDISADVWEGAACYEEGYLCSCPDGPGEHQGTGDTFEDEFGAYIGAWHPEEGCFCTPQ